MARLAQLRLCGCMRLPWPVRLRPGEDLRTALQAVVAARGASAAFVLAGIGSVRPACVRLAGAEAALCLDGDVELLSLSGTIAANGVHLHLSVADERRGETSSVRTWQRWRPRTSSLRRYGPLAA